jgi:FkbM family methyltransferase
VDTLRLLRPLKGLWGRVTGGRFKPAVTWALRGAVKTGIIRPAWYRCDEGFWMYLNPVDLVQRTIRITGTWEPHQVAWLKDELAPGATFIDVGANVGYFALLASQRVGPLGTVIAIEPSRRTADLLERNATRNGAPLVLEQCACTDDDACGTVALFQGADSGETSLASGAAGSQRSEQIPAKTLDRIVRERGLTRVDVIKIDVEGAEYQVLSGAKRTLAEFRPKLMIELEPENLKHFGLTVANVLDLLRGLGYVADRQLRPPDYVFAFDGAAGAAAAHVGNLPANRLRG